MSWRGKQLLQWYYFIFFLHLFQYLMVTWLSKYSILNSQLIIGISLSVWIGLPKLDIPLTLEFKIILLISVLLNLTLGLRGPNSQLVNTWLWTVPGHAVGFGMKKPHHLQKTRDEIYLSLNQTVSSPWLHLEVMSKKVINRTS